MDVYVVFAYVSALFLELFTARQVRRKKGDHDYQISPFQSWYNKPNTYDMFYSYPFVRYFLRHET